MMTGIGVIGLIFGLVMIALGLAMLVGLVRLLCDRKSLAALLLGLALLGGVGMGLVGLLLFAVPMSVEVNHRPKVAPPRRVGEGWVGAPSEGTPVFQRSISQGPSGQTITETIVLPPRSAPVQSPTIQAIPVVAEVTKIEDELSSAPTTENVTKPALDAAPATPAVAPRAEVAPSPRPDWLDRTPESIEGDYRLVVVSGLFPTVSDSDDDLLAKARKQLADYYVKEHSIEEEHLPVPEAELYPLVTSQVLRERYTEPVQSDVLETTMYRKHGLLVIGPELRSKLDEIWTAQIVDRRLVHTSQGAGGLLALLLVAWGTLKMTGRRKAEVGVPSAGVSPR